MEATKLLPINLWFHIGTYHFTVMKLLMQTFSSFWKHIKRNPILLQNLSRSECCDDNCAWKILGTLGRGNNLPCSFGITYIRWNVNKSMLPLFAERFGKPKTIATFGYITNDFMSLAFNGGYTIYRSNRILNIYSVGVSYADETTNISFGVGIIAYASGGIRGTTDIKTRVYAMEGSLVFFGRENQDIPSHLFPNGGFS